MDLSWEWISSALSTLITFFACCSTWRLCSALAALVVVLEDPGAARAQAAHVLRHGLELRLERGLVLGVLIQPTHALQPHRRLVVVRARQRLLERLRRAAEVLEVQVRLRLRFVAGRDERRVARLEAREGLHRRGAHGL